MAENSSTRRRSLSGVALIPVIPGIFSAIRAKVGRISYNSPLGRALIGRKAGEEIEVTVPSGDRFYVVKKIEFI